MVFFQTEPGLSQKPKFKGILKIKYRQWIKNAQPKLVLKDYLKKAMLNQAQILLQTLKKKNKKQIVKVIKQRKMNSYKLRLY